MPLWRKLQSENEEQKRDRVTEKKETKHAAFRMLSEQMRKNDEMRFYVLFFHLLWLVFSLSVAVYAHKLNFPPKQYQIKKLCIDEEKSCISNK